MAYHHLVSHKLSLYVFVCAAVIVENKQTNKQKNTHWHVELLITS